MKLHRVREDDTVTQGQSQGENVCVFLERELQQRAGEWDAERLRRQAAKLLRWARQMLFKADVLDGGPLRTVETVEYVGGQKVRSISTVCN